MPTPYNKSSPEQKTKRRIATSEWKKRNKSAVAVIDARAGKKYRQTAKGKVSRKRMSDSRRLVRNLLIRTKRLLQRSSRPNQRVMRYIGCTPSELRSHLEEQFQAGMSWENYGVGENCWSVDHIRPLATFDLSLDSDRETACHFTNLQPMWFLENSSKGAKWAA